MYLLNTAIIVKFTNTTGIYFSNSIDQNKLCSSIIVITFIAIKLNIVLQLDYIIIITVIIVVCYYM